MTCAPCLLGAFLLSMALWLSAYSKGACADNTAISSESHSSASSAAAGGAGGNATGIGMVLGGDSQGGAGGAGGAGGVGGVGHGGTGGTGQGGAAYNTGSGNAQNLNFEQQRQSPAVFMQAPMPTAACQASVGGFLSFIGGAGFAYSRTLRECEIREASRLAYSINQSAMAKELICMGEYASQTKACAD